MSDFELAVGVVGTDAASQALRSVGAAQQSVTQQTTAQAAATNAASQSTAVFGAGMQTTAQRVQGMASQVAALAGHLGGGALGQAAGLVGSLAGVAAQAAAMGATMGPAGAIGGAITGLLPIIASLASAHRDAADAAREQAVAEQEAANTILEQRRRLSTTTDVHAGVFGGDTTDQQLQVERETRRARALTADDAISHLEERVTQLRRSGREEQARAFEEGIAERRAELADLRAEIANIDTEVERRSQASGAAATTTRTVAPTTPTTPHGGGGPRREDGQARLDAELQAAVDQQAAIDAALEQGLKTRAEMQAAADEANAEHARAQETHAAEVRDRQTQEAITLAKHLADAQRDLADAAMTAQQAFGSGYVSSIDQVVASWRTAEQQTRASAGVMLSQSRLMERGMVATGNNIAETIGGTMKGAFESALGAWLDGSKSFVEAAEAMAKGVLKALVTESIVQAVTEGARGIADLASYHYDSAALHFAAAAAWAGVGVVAGGIGAAVGAFGGGGAGAGSGASSTETRNAAHESTREQANQAPVTFNVYPGGYITKGDVQKGIVDAINQAGRNGYQIRGYAVQGA